LPPPVFRFAPSPNGHLHLGHAYSALLNERLARAAGGRFLLRIEDIDEARCTPALVDDLLEDLAWLGLSWEGPVRRQSEHFGDYASALDHLGAMGLLYPSAASRLEIAEAVARAEQQAGSPWPRDPDGAPLFPRVFLPDAPVAERMPEPRALRLDMGRALAKGAPACPLSWMEEGRGRVAAEPARWGDVVLRRKDVAASYHIAVVVDDALQGVSHVVRGSDLYQATSIHRLLQTLLGLPEPTYLHHELIRGGSGEKLSKSLASRSLRDLRRDGVGPGEIRAMVGLE
jgi:glutamyl-Q tRNA(Asp) synthetase